MKSSAWGRTRGEILPASRGFTLIELLVVVVIISVLAALLLPAFRKSVRSAQTAGCVSNEKALIAGFIGYAGENNGRLPEYADESNEMESMWWNRIGPYLGMETSLTRRAGAEFLRCPSADKSTVLSYGVNYGPYGLAPVSYNAGNASFPGSMRLSQIPVNTFILADHADKSAGSAVYNPRHYELDTDTDGDGEADSYSAFLPDYPYNHLGMRHDRSAVFAFPDGSVRVIRSKEWARAKKDATGLWGN